jgi:tagaturonate reductase
MTGMRDGKPYSIQDDESALHFFEDLYKKTSDPKALAHETLAHTAFWGQDLTRLAGLEEAVASSLDAIQKKGMKQAIADLVK